MTDGRETELFAGQRATLRALLDVVIPGDPARSLPGAGEAGAEAAVLEAAAAQPELAAMLAGALARIDALSRERTGKPFARARRAAREAIATDFDRDDPTVLATLLFHAVCWYYRQPRVLAALGREPRPPHPDGYPMEPEDLGALLDPVRRRAPFYRRVPGGHGRPGTDPDTAG